MNNPKETDTIKTKSLQHSSTKPSSHEEGVDNMYSNIVVQSKGNNFKGAKKLNNGDNKVGDINKILV